MTILTLSHLLCRLLLAFSILVFALDGISVAALAQQQGTGGLHPIEWAAVFCLSGLLLFIFIWLLFGLQTRVMASLGLILFAGQLLWFERLGLQTQYGSAHLAITILLAFPLLILGGGRFAIYRRGWRLPV
ncbi:hypothetical protein [Nioella aestuarii]|uniref:hypothetical protein n=1 Tax=Nioella aestuarii TaxID=1662864 RepID=UPI003D7F8B2A